MRKKHAWKFYVVLTLVVLVLVVAFQNTHVVRMEILFFTVNPPLILLIFACVAIGLAIGWFWHRRRGNKVKEMVQDAAP